MAGFATGFNEGINAVATISEGDRATQQMILDNEVQKQDLNLRAALGTRSANLQEKVANQDYDIAKQKLEFEKSQLAAQADANKAQAALFWTQNQSAKEDIKSKQLGYQSDLLDFDSKKQTSSLKKADELLSARVKTSNSVSNLIEDYTNRNGGDVNKLLANPEDSAVVFGAVANAFTHPANVQELRDMFREEGLDLPSNEGAIRFKLETDFEKPGMVRAFAITDSGNTYDLGDRDFNDIYTSLKQNSGGPGKAEDISTATGVTDPTALARIRAAQDTGGIAEGQLASYLDGRKVPSEELRKTTIKNVVSEFMNPEFNSREDYQWLKSGDGLEANLTKETTRVINNAKNLKILRDAGLISTTKPEFFTQSDWDAITYGALELFKSMKKGTDSVNPLIDGIQANEVSVMQRGATRGMPDQSNRHIVSGLRQAVGLVSNIGDSLRGRVFGFDTSPGKKMLLEQQRQADAEIERQRAENEAAAEQFRQEGLRDYRTEN